MAQHNVYIGRAIGNYRIEQEIASGSFGTVYLASHLYLKQRTVVIKILHALHLGSDEEKEQFLQEAQILETLKGLANILPLLDVGIDGNVPYMIAEYAEQGSLRAYMRQHGVPLSLQEALTITEQVGRGLQNAHNQGIVHRDLKPENILFNAKGEALLADFGIATMLSTGSVVRTQVAGTPSYMAPEQFLGEVSKESDQYGLACITYELLTGRKLFEAPDFVSMGFLHTTKAPTPARQLNPEIPASVEHALLRALSKDRTERYPSVSGFVAALKNIRNDDDRGTLLEANDLHTRPSTISYNSIVSTSPSANAPTEVFYPSVSSNEATPSTHHPIADGTHPRMRNVSPISPGWSPSSGPMSPYRTPSASRNRQGVIVAAIVILTLLLLVLGGLELVNPNIIANIIHGTSTPSSPSPATITITPASKTVQDTYALQGVTGNANPDNRQVTVRQLTSTKTATDTVNATGHTQTPGAAATGNIAFFNGSATIVTVPAGTTFQVGNVQIVTDTTVVVPPATPIQPGQAMVTAHAVPAGTIGNIAAFAINQPCCGSPNVTAQNQNAFTGGQDTQDYHFLQQSDVDKVTTARQGKLKSDAQNDIKTQRQAGEQLLGAINCPDPKTTEDVTPGDQGPNKAVTTAHVTVSMTCSAQAYDSNAVQTIAQNLLKQKATQDPGTGYALAGNIVTQVQPPQAQSPQVLQDGYDTGYNSNVTLQATAKGIWYYQWTDANKQDLLNQIKGKSITQAHDILNGYAGVGNAKIDISNGSNTLPTDVNQITLDIKTVKGL